MFGLIVRARNYFSNLGACPGSQRCRRDAFWRFDCSEIGDLMSEVAAYGTAVTVEPVLDDTPGEYESVR